MGFQYLQIAQLFGIPNTNLSLKEELFIFKFSGLGNSRVDNEDNYLCNLEK